MKKKLLFLSALFLFLPVLAFAEHHEGEGMGHEGHEHHQGDHHGMMMFCKENPDDEKCQEFRERKKRMERRVAHCEEHPDDERCMKMKKKMEERSSGRKAIREACSADPKSETCQAMKEERKAKMKERMDKCKNNPELCGFHRGEKGEGEGGAKPHPKMMRGEPMQP